MQLSVQSSRILDTNEPYNETLGRSSAPLGLCLGGERHGPPTQLFPARQEKDRNEIMSAESNAAFVFSVSYYLTTKTA